MLPRTVVLLWVAGVLCGCMVLLIIAGEWRLVLLLKLRLVLLQIVL